MNMHVTPPAEHQATPIYVPTDVTPEELFQAIGRLRKEAQDAVEQLLAFLDETEGDADLEPSLGAPESWHRDGRRAHVWARGVTDDREATERDDDEEGHDAEPNLGSSAANEWGNQGAWSSGDRNDLEDEHDGSEPSLAGINVETIYGDQDLELDLGTFDQMLNQEKSTLQVGQRHGFEPMGLGLQIPDGEVDDSDFEPSFGGSADGEREDDDEREPSMGWTTDGFIGSGTNDDREDAVGPKVTEARRRQRLSVHDNVSVIIAEWKA